MFPAIWTFLRRFFTDPDYFSARLRTLIMTGGLIGAVEAKEITEALAAPGIEKWVRRGGIVCAGLSLLLRAGDKTPEEVRALAEQMKGAKSAGQAAPPS